jgi:hypothetical protein
VGLQYWKGGVINDACYDSSPQPEDTFTIKGQLKNNLTLPILGSIYNVTEKIPINFATLSECSGYIASENPLVNPSDYKIELSPNGSSWESCSSQDSGQGWYNCTWNSTGKEEGYWNIRLNSSKQYFNDNSTIYNNWFQLVNWEASNTSIPSVTPTQNGWTRLYNYTVAIYDQEGDTINCSLFISRDNQTTWEYKGSSIVPGTPGTPTLGTCYVTVHDFTCSDIDFGSNSKWFKWRIENGIPANAYNTTPIQGPILNESQVSISYIEGNSISINRSSGNNQVRRLAVNVYDDENQSRAYNVSVSFWMTNDSNNYRLDLLNQTDVLGNASYSFDPGCDYAVGKQYWIAGTTDTCYQDLNTTAYMINIIGTITNYRIMPNGEEYLRGEQNAIVMVNASSDCSLEIMNESTILNITYTNETGQQLTCSPVNNELNGSYKDRKSTRLNSSHTT